MRTTHHSESVKIWRLVISTAMGDVACVSSEINWLLGWADIVHVAELSAGTSSEDRVRFPPKSFSRTLSVLVFVTGSPCVTELESFGFNTGVLQATEKGLKRKVDISPNSQPVDVPTSWVSSAPIWIVSCNFTHIRLWFSSSVCIKSSRKFVHRYQNLEVAVNWIILL